MATAVASAYSDPDKEIISHYKGEVHNNLNWEFIITAIVLVITCGSRQMYVSQGLDTALKCCYENIEDTLTVPPEVCPSTFLLNRCHHIFHCNWNIALMKPRLCLAVGWRRSQFCVFERKKSSSNLLISMIKNLFFVSLCQVRPSSLKFIIAGALFLPWCLKFKFNFSYDIIGPCQPAYHEHQNCPRIWDESYCLTTCL